MRRIQQVDQNLLLYAPQEQKTLLKYNMKRLD